MPHSHASTPIVALEGDFKKPRRADPDLLRQLRWIQDNTTKSSAAPLACQQPLFDPADMEQRLTWAGTLSGEGGKMVRRRLEGAKARGVDRSLACAPSSGDLAMLDRRLPNFMAVTQLVRQQAALCGWAPRDGMRLPPILLSGPPGVGKSAYAMELAKVLNVPMHMCDVASATAEHLLSGLDFGYESSKPGLVFEALDGPSMSPLIVLDEIDKPPRGAGVLGGLFRLLEAHTAKQFEDAAVPLRLNASRICWIATCNDASRLDSALLSRFEVLHVEAPTPSQMDAVIGSVHQAMLEEHAWAAGCAASLTHDVRALLMPMPPRQIRRSLLAAYASAAMAGRRHLVAADVPQPTAPPKAFGFIA